MSLLTLQHSAATPSFAAMALAAIANPGISAEEAAASHRRREQIIDDQLAQSFPASDPPSWVQGTSPEPT